MGGQENRGKTSEVEKKTSEVAAAMDPIAREGGYDYNDLAASVEWRGVDRREARHSGRFFGGKQKRRGLWALETPCGG